MRADVVRAPERPRCVREGVTWFAPPPDGERGELARDGGGSFLPVVESMSLVFTGEREPVATWTDSRAARVHLARGVTPRALADISVGAGEHTDPTLVMAGAGASVPTLTWVRETPTGRVHVVRAGETLDQGCDQPETRDDGLGVSVAPVARGLLVAWDEEGPLPAAGSIKVQVVPLPAGPLAPNGSARACPAPRQVSQIEKDAADPLAIPLADGGAAVFWLTARDLDPGENNETVTDIWGVAVDATGAPRGAPLRVTHTTGHRFGLAAVARGSTVWLAWRSSPDSDNEARGDGGEVAIARIDRTPTGLDRASDVTVVTGQGAVPVGAPRVFARSQGDAAVEVWWIERRDGAPVTLHRGVDGTGRAIGDSAVSRDEPALGAELPAGVEAGGAWVATAARTPGGGVGVARYRCDGR